MSARYTPLANPRSALDAEREMEDAFDLNNSDNEADDAAHESTPLNHSLVSPPPVTSSRTTETSSIPGAYDFEREYDYPPPGSPPSPSSRALPNDFGNSNGLLPTSPVDIPQPRQSFFRRAVGAILPTHYQRISSQSSGPTGGGLENDGVFANVTAKPQPARVIRTDDGEVHIVPEDSQKETPPSYVEAQADAVPPYWETTVHTPAGLDGGDMIIDDLPAGTFIIFCVNIFISFFFQFVGFLLTYLLHTSHAAKFGSRAGLGLTLIQYGFYSRNMNPSEDMQDSTGGSGSQLWPDRISNTASAVSSTNSASSSLLNQEVSTVSKDWLSFLFMTLGWFLLLSSIIGYWRIKRWEKSVRAPVVTPSPDDIERDRICRRNLSEAFGYSLTDGSVHQEASMAGNTIIISDAMLQRNLRAAGML